MREFLQKHKGLLSVCLSVACSVFLVAVVASAATTIGLNVTTGGTLTVTGLSTLGHASSSRLSSYLWFGAGGTATTSIDSAGNLSVGGTATITGLTTLGHASSSRLSSYLWFGAGGTATTSIDSAGNLSVGGTADVTGLTTLGKASSSVASAYNGLFVGTTATTTLYGTATSTFGHAIAPVSNNAKDFGGYAAAWRDVYVSGTLRVGGGSATTTVDFSSNGGGTKGNGTCIVLMGGDGTQYYLSVTSTGYLVAGTDSCL